MPELTPLDDNRQEHFLNGEDLEPITRREHFYAGRESELPAGHQEPETREEWFIQKYRGGGGDVTVVPLSVTENGTYSEEGKAYSPVSVNVPLPENAYLKKTATTSISDAVRLPVASAVVSVTDKDKAELFFTSDGVVSEDNTPYTYRPSPSGKNCVDLSVVGGTVAWNQLADKSILRESVTVGDLTLTNNNDGYLYISGSITNSFVELSGNLTLNFIKGHKYLFNIPTAPSGVNRLLTLYGTAFGNFTLTSATIIECNNTLSERIYPRFGSNESVSVNNFKYYIGVIDLTQAFGSTIADYIYSLEQATAGSGIAWLKANGFFTKDYYAYDSGSLQSVNVSSRKVYDNNDTLVATYPLDSDLTLRGIVKKDANNNLYYDGDVYNADGSVKRKYGVVDFSTLSWNYNSGWGIWVSDLSLAKVASDTSVMNGVSDKFAIVMASGYTTSSTVGTIAVNTSKQLFCNNGSSTNEPTGMLVYELATPTSETADAYENPQLVGSTEEFIDTRDVPIPVGQDSKYVNGNIYIKYLDSVTTGDIELADENAIIPLENTTYISSNGSASIDYWSKEV